MSKIVDDLFARAAKRAAPPTLPQNVIDKLQEIATRNDAGSDPAKVTEALVRGELRARLGIHISVSDLLKVVRAELGRVSLTDPAAPPEPAP